MSKGVYKRPTLEERFWPQVDKKSVNECWNWLGSPKTGYGHIKFNGSRVSIGTHRVAWILTYGIIPHKKQVCHKCDNPRCCNPQHLFLGTPKQNIHDMLLKGRGAGQKGTRYQPNVSGENNGRAKLTKEDVEAIRIIGRIVGTKWLSNEFGVSVSTICRILKGTQWVK